MNDVSSVDATILLLESDSVTRTVLCEALERAGHLVITAGDLGAAVDRMDEMQPDLLIVSPYINSMPAHMAADYLRSTHPGLCVLVVAGLLDDDRIRVRNAIRGFHTFPNAFTRDEFVTKVKEVLKHKSKRVMERRTRKSS